MAGRNAHAESTTVPCVHFRQSPTPRSARPLLSVGVLCRVGGPNAQSARQEMLGCALYGVGLEPSGGEVRAQARHLMQLAGGRDRDVADPAAAHTVDVARPAGQPAPLP